MNAIKEFLKPNLWKVVLFIVLSAFFLLSERHTVIGGELIVLIKGFPLPIETGDDFSWTQGNPLLIVYLIVDLIFWYLLACLIYFIFTKLKEFLKEFLKPNRWKMLISLVLLLSFLSVKIYFDKWELILPQNALLLFLIVNLIFYSISCFIYFIFKKIRNLKREKTTSIHP